MIIARAVESWPEAAFYSVAIVAICIAVIAVVGILANVNLSNDDEDKPIEIIGYGVDKADESS